MDGSMIIGIAIGVVAGVPFGVLIMGILSARAYEKGRSDVRAGREGGVYPDPAKWILQEQR
jgi:hypothetical protein